MSHRHDRLTVSPVTKSEREIVARMLQLYLHDFSEFAKINEPYGELRADGTFWYPDHDRYWSSPDRGAYLMRIGEHFAGFALVNQWSASGLGVDHAIAEFFVLRKYRRLGTGTTAAKCLIAQHPGIWDIPVASYNQPALILWRTVVASMISSMSA